MRSRDEYGPTIVSKEGPNFLKERDMYATEQAVKDVLERLSKFKYKLNESDLWIEIVDQVTAQVERELFPLAKAVNSLKPTNEEVA